MMIGINERKFINKKSPPLLNNSVGTDFCVNSLDYLNFLMLKLKNCSFRMPSKAKNPT